VFEKVDDYAAFEKVLCESGGDGSRIEGPATQRGKRHAFREHGLAANDGETVGAGIDVALSRASQVERTPENRKKMRPDPISPYATNTTSFFPLVTAV
jgi:hypothetical protein